MSVKKGEVCILILYIDITNWTVKQLETHFPETHQGVHVTSYTPQKEQDYLANCQ